MSWRQLLTEHAPLRLPAAHDALTARLIERAGFQAYQIGGFALSAARHALPAIDLTRFGERAAASATSWAGPGCRCWWTPMTGTGFSMILYPRSLLFRAVRAIEEALADLRQGKPSSKDDAVDLQQWEAMVDGPFWAAIEKRFGARQKS